MYMYVIIEGISHFRLFLYIRTVSYYPAHVVTLLYLIASSASRCSSTVPILTVFHTHSPTFTPPPPPRV